MTVVGIDRNFYRAAGLPGWTVEEEREHTRAPDGLEFVSTVRRTLRNSTGDVYSLEVITFEQTPGVGPLRLTGRTVYRPETANKQRRMIKWITATRSGSPACASRLE